MLVQAMMTNLIFLIQVYELSLLIRHLRLLIRGYALDRIQLLLVLITIWERELNLGLVQLVVRLVGNFKLVMLSLQMPLMNS